MRELHTLSKASHNSSQKSKKIDEHQADKEFELYWASDAAKRQQFVCDRINRRNPYDLYATSRDHDLRELEILAIREGLLGRPPGRLIDIGCGNGYTLTSLAKELIGWSLVGVDFADRMIDGANKLANEKRNLSKSIPTFVCDDALRYLSDLKSGSVDCFLTERFLLNLPSDEVQRTTIREISRALKTGGRLLMCEGSLDGFRKLNRIRTRFGLKMVAETSADNISAIRFQDSEIERFLTEDLRLKLIGKRGFSIYFFISRVIHPWLVAPKQPRFNSKINSFGRFVQTHLRLKPGIGSNVLWVLDK